MSKKVDPQHVIFDEDGPDTTLARSLSSRERDLINENQTTEAAIELVMPNQRRRPSAFRQVTGPGAGRDLRFTEDRMVIGRSRSTDFPIDSPELSRRHVEVYRVGNSVICRDLDSRNGVYLNGIRIYSCVLMHGDTLQMGNVTFVFNEAP